MKISKFSRFIFFSIMIIYSSLCVEKEDKLFIRGGIIQAISGENEHPSTIILNKKIIFQSMDPYISIDQLITSEKFDLITFFTEAGGNATSAMRRALIVQPNSEFKVFKDDISSPTGVFVPSLKDEVIEIDLGYVNGQKKSIKITSDGLISIGKLSTKDLVATTYENCQWIIKDLFPLCAESKESCKNVLENQSMSIKRSIIIFENNPNFSKKNLSVMCDDVCRWRKVRFTNEQISHLICRLDMSK